MVGSAQDAYRSAQVQAARPEQLVLMLYDGARARVSRAKLALAAGDYDRARDHMLRAQAIVGELLASLDMSAGEMARNLSQIYEYVNHRLIEANIKHDIAGLDVALRILGELRDGWQEMAARRGSEAARRLAAV